MNRILILRRKRASWPLFLTALAAAAIPVMAQSRAPSPQPSQPNSRESFRERYGVLSDRNVFVRDRRAPRRDEPASRQAPRAPEQTFVLTGVVFEDGGYRAYMEDRAAGTTQRLGPGDAIARGRITQIQMDAVEYTQGDRSVWVEIGKDLTGAQALSRAELMGQSTTGPSLPDPNNPNLTVEERMRLRRAQQQGNR